jgi:tripartite ATP-independent transporter DctM subunit
MATVALLARGRNYPAGEKVAAAEAGGIVFRALPSLLLIVLVMGGIILGWFTPTEASAIAVAYTFILSVLVYREVPWRELPAILTDSALTTAVVLLLIGTSMGMSWVMSLANIPQAVTAGLLAITEDKVLLLLIIFTPILLPVVQKLGMSPLHFGLMLIFNLCIGLCTPPVGNCLFVGCGVAQTTIARVWRPLLPFFGAMLVVLLLVTFWPALSLALPRALGF